MKERVVISMTTLPNRYDYLLKTLTCLHNQTVKVDAIYLTLPKQAKRSGLYYPELPDEIKKLCTVVHVDLDYGPILKIYGGLMKESDSTIIITADDDVVYPSDFVSIFLKKHQLHPNCAITGRGILVGLGTFYFGINNLTYIFKGITGFRVYNGRQVDIVQGVSGCLYKRSFFPQNDQLYDKLLKYTKDEDVFKSDDILISGYLCKNNIKIYTFFDMPDIYAGEGSPDALSMDTTKMIKTFDRTLDKLKNLGFFPKYASMHINDSFLYNVGFITFLILFLIIIIIMFLI